MTVPPNIKVLPLMPHSQVVERTRRERRDLTETIAMIGLGEQEIDDRTNPLSSSHRHPASTAAAGIRRREEAQQVGALYHGYGTHYVDLWCGTPPQRQTVIVDTGSGVTAFPCSGCKDCGVPDYHIDRLFIEDDSSTFSPNTCGKDNSQSRSDCMSSRSRCTNQQCKISMSYAEGSRWDAYEGIDRCYVAGPHEIPLVVTDPAQAGEGVNTVNKEGYSGVEDVNPIRAPQLAFDLVFGCQTLVTGLFKTQLADGIMGMNNRPETFWHQMYDANKMGANENEDAPKAFSLCFSRPVAADREGTEAGALTLGGTDPRLHHTPMVFTPRASKGRASFYSVKVRRIMLREGRAGETAMSSLDNPTDGIVALNLDADTLNKSGIIVDSGTTDTYWNVGIASEFKKVFSQLSDGRAFNNNPMALSEKDLHSLPTILFQLESSSDMNNEDSGITDANKTPGLAGALDPDHPTDVILALPPSHYMEYDEKSKTYTARFYPTERSGSVLGANAMMGHEVFFDMDNDRIGWSESDCSYSKLVHDGGYAFDITGELKDPETIDDNGQIVPVAQPTVDCESLHSGSKCQEAGCNWYWGKCQAQADGPGSDEEGQGDKDGADPPSSTPASGGDNTKPSSSSDPTTPGSSGDLEPHAVPCSNLACILPVSIGLLIALCTGCFVFYSCCCSTSSYTADRSKYLRAAITEEEIEMNGLNLSDHHNGDNDSFQDEPDDSHKSNGNGNGHSMGRQTSSDSSYKDEPDVDDTSNGYKDGPEFEGDFA